LISIVHNEIKGATLGDQDRYVMMFTCGHCNHKDTKTFTKKSYHTSVVIIKCEGCGNNHLIADNLGWFRDEKVNIEDLSKEKGQTITRVNNSPRLQQILQKIKFVGVRSEHTINSDNQGQEPEGKIESGGLLGDSKNPKSH
jgi:protein import protein ZIM17